MRKLIITLSIVCTAFLLKAQDYSNVFVSDKLTSNKQYAVVFSSFPTGTHLTFRDGKRNFNYYLKQTDNIFYLGLPSAIYSVYLDNKKIDGFNVLFCNSIPIKGKEPFLVFQIRGSEDVTFSIKQI